MKKLISKHLLRDVRTLIEETRRDVARSVNTAQVAMYWSIGSRIRQDILKGKRAGYGEQIVNALSAQLEAEYGRGYSSRNLW